MERIATSILSVLMLALMHDARGQSLSRKLMASTGSTATSASYRLDFSVGDLVVTTAASASFVLTQGFQQADDFSTAVELIAGDGAGLVAFPNPTRDAVTLLWDAPPTTPYSVGLFSMQGELVLSESDLVTPRLALDLSGLAAGMYSVHVITEGGSPILLRVQKMG